MSHMNQFKGIVCVQTAIANYAGIPVLSSIKKALCVDSEDGNSLNVDGVVLIGEHGDCAQLPPLPRTNRLLV
eukprot:SAG11_NODE_22924_length_398_cov_0.658863_2_plen_72_part_00